MIECDILIVTVPVTDTGDKPLQAPAVLSAVVKKEGYTAKTMDLNHQFHKLEKVDKEKYDMLKNYFMMGSLLDVTKYQAVEQYVESVIDDILETTRPRFLAVSVFTYLCQKFAEILAEKIKARKTEIKIIFGGMGLQSQGINSSFEWPERLKSAGIIDYYIASEGEKSLLNLLGQGKGPGINNTDWEQQTDLDQIVYPDYSDYNFNDYNTKQLMITGSRGCVRKCTFCDIHNHWKKFVFRSGESIADEMITQSKKYGIYDFMFTDSLVNGSMKAYRQFVTVLAEYNKTAQNKITWNGQFIVRGIKQMNEEDWRLTKESGATCLFLGIESGSESVRNHMQKKFSDDDMDKFMEQAFKNRVKCLFLIIVGYLNETHKDFLQTLKMFKRYTKYQEIMDPVACGTTLGILPGTGVWTDHMDDISLNGGENFWTYKYNPGLDFRERIKRRIIMEEELLKMGYEISGSERNFKFLHFLWNVYKNSKQQTMVQTDTSGLLKDQRYS